MVHVTSYPPSTFFTVDPATLDQLREDLLNLKKIKNIDSSRGIDSLVEFIKEVWPLTDGRLEKIKEMCQQSGENTLCGLLDSFLNHIEGLRADPILEHFVLGVLPEESVIEEYICVPGKKGQYCTLASAKDARKGGKHPSAWLAASNRYAVNFIIKFRALFLETTEQLLLLLPKEKNA